MVSLKLKINSSFLDKPEFYQSETGYVAYSK